MWTHPLSSSLYGQKLFLSSYMGVQFLNLMVLTQIYTLEATSEKIIKPRQVKGRAA